MKGARSIAYLMLALAVTGLSLYVGAMLKVWQATLAIVMVHVVLASILVLTIGPFLWKHLRAERSSRASVKSRGLLLLSLLISVVLSGTALAVFGRRGNLSIIHWAFSIFLFLAVFRHARYMRPQSSLKKPAWLLKVAAMATLCIVILLASQTPRSQSAPFTRHFLPASMKLVGELPAYDKASMSPESCANCHAKIVEEWKQSLHSVADTEIIYSRVVGEFRQKHGIEASNWCAGCHSPLRLARGQLSLKIADVDQPNVDCVTCHSIQHIHEPVGSNNYDLSVRPAIGYEVAKPLNLSNRLMLMHPGAHQDRWNASLIRSAEFCGACHRQVVPKFLTKSNDNPTIQDTFGEWQQSRFNSEDPAQRRTCQDCHMPEDHGFGIVLGFGSRSHLFAGGSIDIAQLSGARTGVKAHKRLLSEAATISLEAAECGSQGVGLHVKVTNYGAGHNLPTGVTDLREVWLEVTATNSSGKVVYQSGSIDSDGFLDPQAIRFRVTLGDEERKPVHFHDIIRARYVLEDTTIRAGETRDVGYLLPIADASTAKIDVRLLYRTVPQDFLNHFMTADLRFQAITMATSSLSLDVSARCKLENVAGTSSS